MNIDDIRERIDPWQQLECPHCGALGTITVIHINCNNNCARKPPRYMLCPQCDSRT